jgi:hypothetical protein
VTGREDEHVSLRGKDNHEPWHELSVILDLTDAPEHVKPGSIDNFYAASRLLRSNLGAIEQAFADENYPALKVKLDDWYSRRQVRLKALSTELNRQLYG